MATMSEREEWQEWDLTGLEVTQLRLDYALHVHLWTLERDFLLALGTPFEFHSPSKATVTLDPAVSEATAPVLSLLHKSAASFAASSLGRCVLRMADGTELRSGPHPTYEAWESRGSGDLEAASFLCDPAPAV